LDSVSIIDQTAEELGRGNRATADYYRRVCLNRNFETGDLENFARACADLIGTGWKSHEAVDSYLSIAESELGTDRLLHVGEIGRQLCGYSYEPSKAYFHAVGVAASCGKADELPSIEANGLRIQAKYSHAAGLLGDFFLTAGYQLQHLDTEALHAWFETVGKCVDATRELLTSLLPRDDTLAGINWHFVVQIVDLSVAAAATYVAGYPVIEKLPDRLRRQVDELVLRFVEGHLASFIDVLPALADHKVDEASVLLELVDQTGDVSLAVALIQNAHRLPLNRPGLLRQWLSIGLTETRGKNDAVLAWVSVESSMSVETLEKLEGEVRFENHRRTFDLIAEAIAGQRMLVTASDTEAEYGQAGAASGLSAFDGRNITLPAAVSIFDREDDNFGFYKLSLFHQLGYVRFGCFDEIARVNSTLAEYDDSRLAEKLFLVVEDARIDWRLEYSYPGIGRQLYRQKTKAWSMRVRELFTRRAQLLEVIVAASLDARYESRIESVLWPEAALLWMQLQQLKSPKADIEDTLAVTHACYELIRRDASQSSLHRRKVPLLSLGELPEPVTYRGELDVAAAESTLKIEALIDELQEEVSSDAESLMLATGNPDQFDIEDLKKGDVDEGVSITLEELAHELDVDLSDLQPASKEEALALLGGIAAGVRDSTRYFYDEWDHSIGDYRARWCTLFEHHDMELDEDYYRRTLVDYERLSHRIRHHLNKVRPEMLRKVRGFPEGEELDLERTVTWFVDRKAGYTPEEKIYIQRQRKERDVSTLFLLDMSASTDDIIPDPDKEPVIDPGIDDDEYLIEYFRLRKEYEDDARRIIDLEKEAVILMAEALEKLGDAYSVCGFSGYGREQVDYYLCKDFDDPLDALARGRIGGIKPCRSTRMGAPIRHGVRRLLETESRIKAMIIISDGYPQDHDYGMDRNSREYGLMDTMKALSEAKQQGVLTHCLTVDPSGHDYLRDMCADSQYMVIQDIEQLPEELSRVYRSLTG
jgi:nitric oxide reductase NorD protein